MTQNTRRELARKSPGGWIVQHFLFKKLMLPQSWEFRLQLSLESVMLKGQPASSVRCQSITADCCRLMKQGETGREVLLGCCQHRCKSELIKVLGR